MPGPASTRPLVGEPLSLDLLNTVWMSRGAPVDLFDAPDGLTGWLTETGLVHEAKLAGPEPTETELAALRSATVTARDAIREHLRDPESDASCAALNEVLAWGRSWPVVGPDGVHSDSAVDDPAHRPGWLAALNYAELLAAAPDRVRRCAHPECVLTFYDTSPKRSRRWCSMAGCGNRAKAARHYARTKSNGS